MSSLDPSAFYSQETIIRSQIRLSAYDQLGVDVGKVLGLISLVEEG